LGLLIIIVILGLMYVLFMVPARRRRQQHAAMQDSVGIGDEVITAGGLHGHVHELDDENRVVRVEIAPDVIVTVDRRAIAAVARETEVELELESTPDSDSETPAEPR
jgi:preprotein translocase subunit YajC